MKKKTLLKALAAITLGSTAALGMALAGCSHKHEFDTSKWKSDETGHWHEATCDHKDQQGDFAKHNYGENGKDQYCLECNYENPDYEAPAPQKTPLAKPVLTLTDNVLSWEAVEHATKYEVYNGTTKKADVLTTATLEYTITESGSYTVKAIGDATHSDSVSEAKQYTAPTTPVTTPLAKPVLTITEGVLSWEAVEHATKYEVYNGTTKKAEVLTTAELKYTLTESGSYTVKAIGDDKYTDSVSEAKSYTLPAAPVTEVTAEQWKEAFKDATNFTIDDSGDISKITADRVYESYTTMDNGKEVKQEHIYAKEGDKYYKYRLNDEAKWVRNEITQNEFSNYLLGYSTLATCISDEYESFDYADGVYTALKLDLTKTLGQYAPIFDKVEVTFSNGAVTGITFETTGSDNKSYTTEVKDIGTTTVTLPTDYIDGDEENPPVAENVIVLNQEKTFTVEGYVYLEFTAEKAGNYTITVTKDGEPAEYIYVYTKAEYEKVLAGSWDYDLIINGDETNVGVVKLAADEKLELAFEVLDSDIYGDYTVKITEGGELPVELPELELGEATPITVPATVVHEDEEGNVVTDVEGGYVMSFFAESDADTYTVKVTGDNLPAAIIVNFGMGTTPAKLTSENEYTATVNLYAWLNYKVVISYVGEGEADMTITVAAVVETLAAPENVEIDEDGVLTWDAVEGAYYYAILKDGAIVGYVYPDDGDERAYPLTLNGEYRVIAVDGDLNPGTPSDPVVYENGEEASEPLDAPTNLTIENGVLTWDEVAGANGYQVYLDGAETPVTTEALTVCEYTIPTDLEAGAHTYAVKALGNGETNSDSNLSATVPYTVAETPAGFTVAQYINVTDLTAGVEAEAEIKEGSGIYATSALSIQASGSSVDIVLNGETISLNGNRLQIAGTSKAEESTITNGLKFVVEANATIVIYGISKNAADIRSMALYGSDLNMIGSKQSVDGTSVTTVIFQTETAGTYYVGCPDDGVNIYYIAVAYGELNETYGEPVEASAAKCTEEGNIAYSVSNFGRYKKADGTIIVASKTVIAKLDHSYSLREENPVTLIPEENTPGTVVLVCATGNEELVVPLPELTSTEYTTRPTTGTGTYKYTTPQGVEVTFEAAAVEEKEATYTEVYAPDFSDVTLGTSAEESNIYYTVVKASDGETTCTATAAGLSADNAAAHVMLPTAVTSGVVKVTATINLGADGKNWTFFKILNAAGKEVVGLRTPAANKIGYRIDGGTDVVGEVSFSKNTNINLEFIIDLDSKLVTILIGETTLADKIDLGSNATDVGGLQIYINKDRTTLLSNVIFSTKDKPNAGTPEE